jgi:predicted ATP-dependent endonuclease of OLD family
MRLLAFRIINFRSIIDTGWQNLSPDNITCLIGQNESGKTSILEGLRVFYSGVISEDVLRSDLSLPEINCRFSIPKGWLVRITDNPGTELKELLAGLDQIELTRKWLSDLSSVVTVSGQINNYLESLENAWRLYLNEVSNKLTAEMSVIEGLEKEIENLSVRESELLLQINGKAVANKLAWPWTRIRNGAIKMPDPQKEELIKKLNEVQRSGEEARKILSDKEAVRKVGNHVSVLRNKSLTLGNSLNDIELKLEERHQKMTMLMRPIDDHSDPEWINILKNYRVIRDEKNLAESELEKSIALSGFIMQGMTRDDAEAKVDETIKSYKSQYNSEMLGSKYFEYCPVIEMFEDFGSLLPNRIDMEDLVTGNENVEGYKAAQNFLIIAQLDYSFFQQPSSRILKQKIEKLNQSLTLNFQDFWQQSIGRNNKISIQFELDHFDSSHGAKAGKPYLEFWIKDEGERLYPKQRSRGVRWFLSFYLELMACAEKGHKSLILLVDEPGVSLHARAQEDVLKVFENIRQRIQIIYTTHSPHLVELNKLHRVLAVQRDDHDNLSSATRILDPMSLSAASPDTLTPLQCVMGNPLSTERFSSKRYNLVVNDTGSFYILSAVIKIMDFSGRINLIPSTNVSSIPLMCNVLMGWGLEFAVLLFRSSLENQIADELNASIFKTDIHSREYILRMPSSFLNSEDLLSTLDFKNHILRSRVGITTPNSVYIHENNLPRNFMLSQFLSNVNSGKITSSDLDEETLENFKMFTDMLRGLKLNKI